MAISMNGFARRRAGGNWGRRIFPSTPWVRGSSHLKSTLKPCAAIKRRLLAELRMKTRFQKILAANSSFKLVSKRKSCSVHAQIEGSSPVSLLLTVTQRAARDRHERVGRVLDEGFLIEDALDPDRGIAIGVALHIGLVPTKAKTGEGALIQ